jgi:hypothetical protein
MIALLFTSIDSFLGAAALAMLGLTSQRKRITCLMFGMCDAIATYIGQHINNSPIKITLSSNPSIASISIGAWVLTVALIALCVSRRKPTSMPAVSLIPILFSVDNLVAGGSSSQPFSFVPVEPVAVLLLSATLAAAGCAIASYTRNHLSEPMAICAGASLLCLTPILI